MISMSLRGNPRAFCDAVHIIPRAKGHSVRSRRCCPHPTLVHPISLRTTHQGLRLLMSTMCEMVEGFSRPGAVAFLKVRDKDTPKEMFSYFLSLLDSKLLCSVTMTFQVRAPGYTQNFLHRITMQHLVPNLGLTGFLIPTLASLTWTTRRPLSC